MQWGTIILIQVTLTDQKQLQESSQVQKSAYRWKKSESVDVYAACLDIKFSQINTLIGHSNAYRLCNQHQVQDV